jgi:YHS domain-containing protein
MRIDDGSLLRSKALETEAAIELTSPVAGEVQADADTITDADVTASGVGTGKPAAAKPVNELCPVSGSPIKAGFTREYKGKLVGFCCPNCPKAFDANPEQFASKLQ